MWPKFSASVSVPDGEDADIVNKEMKAQEADIQEKSTAGIQPKRSQRAVKPTNKYYGPQWKA